MALLFVSITNLYKQWHRFISFVVICWLVVDCLMARNDFFISNSFFLYSAGTVAQFRYINEHTTPDLNHIIEQYQTIDVPSPSAYIQ